MNIPNIRNKIKGQGRILLILVLLACLSGVSFYIGYSARAEADTGSPVIIQCPKEAYIQKASEAQKGVFLASRNGSKYYPLECPGASRIKEENKVWFSSEEEAINAGYDRTTSC